MSFLHRFHIALLFPFAVLLCASAQDNYEIQVYGSDQVAPNHTMVELHSNFTVDGSKEVHEGVEPSEHAVHETVEITQGWTDWFETGFYIFTAIQPNGGWEWVGDHIRPRVRVPESWKWPVGVSLSNEIGYQRRAFSPDTWTWEIRPVIDRKLGRWYLAFNPTLDRSFHGASVHKGVGFSPNAKVGYDFTRRINGGIEYYGSLGPITGFDPLRDEQQQIVPSIDLDLGPNWEFNAGVGVGVTGGTDHLIVKCIIGRRFSWKTH
ncbi:MAG: hypothetical protein JWO91_1438 [Acidobacteriaceae bacterium]|jgi:hypothetical protein|nr:hypothetical protein [Acidobacteriaceae bacterium]